MASAGPKILNLNAPTIRNQRTLIWLQKQDTAVNWSKWDAVVSGLQGYEYWSQYNTKIVGIIVKEQEQDTDVDTFLQRLFDVSKRVPMLLVSQQVLALKTQDYWVDNYDNILNLDDVLSQYPFLNRPWNGIVLCIAICQIQESCNVSCGSLKGA